MNLVELDLVGVGSGVMETTVFINRGCMGGSYLSGEERECDLWHIVCRICGILCLVGSDLGALVRFQSGNPWAGE